MHNMDYRCTVQTQEIFPFSFASTDKMGGALP
jgi:hypothetical protein